MWWGGGVEGRRDDCRGCRVGSLARSPLLEWPAWLSRAPQHGPPVAMAISLVSTRVICNWRCQLTCNSCYFSPLSSPPPLHHLHLISPPLLDHHLSKHHYYYHHHHHHHHHGLQRPGIPHGLPVRWPTPRRPKLPLQSNLQRPAGSLCKEK